MGNEDLKLMSCPIDTAKCPYGDNAVINLSNPDQRIQKQETWMNFAIRESTICKLKLEYSQAFDFEKINYLNLNTETLSYTDAFLITMPTSGNFNSNTQIQTL